MSKKLHVKKATTGKFIPAKNAKKFKPYPLVSTGPKKEEVIESLKALSDDIELAIKHEIQKIVSDDQIQIEISDPVEDTPKKKGMVQASFMADDPENRALMAVPPFAFSALSELFFGGTPADLKASGSSKKNVTDTEKRLATRLFDAFINTICIGFDKPRDNWIDQWLEKPKQESVAWITVKISSDNWDFLIHLAWPFGLMDHEDPESNSEPVDLRDDLEEVLMNIPLTLTTKIINDKINMEDVASFKKGDILPVSLKSLVSADAGTSAILLGEVKEVDKHLGLQIKSNKIGISHD